VRGSRRYSRGSPRRRMGMRFAEFDPVSLKRTLRTRRHGKQEKMMNKAQIWALTLGGPSLIVLGVGCAGADDPESDAATDWSESIATQRSDLTSPRGQWWRHRPRPQGTGGSVSAGTGGTTSTGGATNVNPNARCEVCAQAKACCDTVNGGPLCTFSASTCAGLQPAAQAAYVNSCLTLLDTTRRAHASARAVAPASCR
jgi:hypothetical protein